MHRDIHRRLIKKMVLGWILLSLAIGTIVAFVEFERIDKYVVNLAQADATKHTDAYHHYYHDPSLARKSKLIDLVDNCVYDSHFVLVELYDQTKNKVVEKALERVESIINDLEEKDHEFLMTDQAEYMRFISGKQLYLKIVTPILDLEQPEEIIGYFEGIYEVPQDKMREIGLRMVWSIAQVIMAILLTTVILYPVIIGLHQDLIRRSLNLSAANLGMLKVLGGAIAKRDSDTNAHNYRVTIYAISLAEKIGMGVQEIRALIKGAFLHDVGKIGISDTILLKPGKLDKEEFAVMRQHVRHGVDIISHYAWLDDAVTVTRYHHERFDGTGYLDRLKGEEIPRNARIFAIADVFDALTSKRPYKEQFSFEKSVKILRDGAGTHFDPVLVAAFLRIARDLYEQLSGNERESYLNDRLEQLVHNYFKEEIPVK
jgi:HD-GYP domain-containing protein (c-di-GMP phosphodiesterase class II)